MNTTSSVPETPPSPETGATTGGSPATASTPDPTQPASKGTQAVAPIRASGRQAGGAPAAPRSQSGEGFRRGLGTGLGFALGAGLVAMALLLVSLFGGLMIGLAGARNQPSADNVSTTHLWGPTNAANTMLAIQVSGAILGSGDGSLFSTATYGQEIADQLDELDAGQYAGVILLMDTPGGSIYGSRAIADAVQRYQERTGNKVIAYVQSMSASGGMYAMSSADLIIADHGTMIGSIGVIMGPFRHYREVTGLTGNILESGVVTQGGITQEYLTQGKGKDFGNPFREMTEEERAVYVQGLELAYQDFVGYVSEHRDIPAQTIVDDIGAHLYDPVTALDKGLIDQIAGRADGFRAAAEANEIDPADTKVVTPSEADPWMTMLGIEKRVWGHNVPLDAASGTTPTSQLCQGAPVVLAYTGDFRVACGS